MKEPGGQMQPRQKHGALMALCGIAPMAVLGALLWLGIIGPWGLYLFFLLCPLTHLLMMRWMRDGSNHGSSR